MRQEYKSQTKMNKVGQSEVACINLWLEYILIHRQKTFPPLTNLKNHFIFLKMFLKSSMLIELMNVQLNNL